MEIDKIYLKPLNTLLGLLFVAESDKPIWMIPAASQKIWDEISSLSLSLSESNTISFEELESHIQKIELLSKEIHNLTLVKDEKAFKKLQDCGVLDEDGKVKSPYTDIIVRK